MFKKSRSHLKIPVATVQNLVATVQNLVATVQNLVATATSLPGFRHPCTRAYLNILGYFYNDCISILVFPLCFRFGI